MVWKLGLSLGGGGVDILKVDENKPGRRMFRSKDKGVKPDNYTRAS
jgi:hypothetical protein